MAEARASSPMRALGARPLAPRSSVPAGPRARLSSEPQGPKINVRATTRDLYFLNRLARDG